jgi:tRNA-2-methylthio-N6-dimethylallyladenosine synthase
MTCDIARRIGYINSYSFKYSPRPHTAAALMPNQIPDNIKRARLAELDNILTENNRRFNESCVGMTMPCLLEGPDKTGKNLIARTPFMQQVIVKAQSANRKALADILITEANKCSLRGEIKN